MVDELTLKPYIFAEQPWWHGIDIYRAAVCKDNGYSLIKQHSMKEFNERIQ
jgi:hypothetical protein